MFASSSFTIFENYIPKHIFRLQKNNLTWQKNNLTLSFFRNASWNLSVGWKHQKRRATGNVLLRDKQKHSNCLLTKRIYYRMYFDPDFFQNLIAGEVEIRMSWVENFWKINCRGRTSIPESRVLCFQVYLKRRSQWIC